MFSTWGIQVYPCIDILQTDYGLNILLINAYIHLGIQLYSVSHINKNYCLLNTNYIYFILGKVRSVIIV